VAERAVSGLLYLLGLVLLTLAAVGWVGGAWASMPVLFAGGIATGVPLLVWAEP
jgi:hypothetical protein